MIDRKEIIDIVNDYNTDNIRIGTVASHSALDVFDGLSRRVFTLMPYARRAVKRPIQIISAPRGIRMATLYVVWSMIM